MKFPEEFRAVHPHPYYRNQKTGDSFGYFVIPGRAANGRRLQVIASDGEECDWDHVSVSLPDSPTKCPSWDEMSIIKELFFEDTETVVQFHPPKEDHVSFHDGCLHLWRWRGEMPRPPSILVGPKKAPLPEESGAPKT